MFVAMLDNNQMYVNKTEMADSEVWDRGGGAGVDGGVFIVMKNKYGNNESRH